MAVSDHALDLEGPPEGETDFDFEVVDRLIAALGDRLPLPETAINAAHTALNAYLDVGRTVSQLEGTQDATFFPLLVGRTPLSLVLDWGQEVWEAWRLQGRRVGEDAASVSCAVPGLDIGLARRDHEALVSRLLGRMVVVE